jgi:hypothetical protein
MKGQGRAGRLTPQDSLMIDRWISRLPLPRWRVVAAIGLVLLITPAVIGYLEDVPQIFADYRAQFVYAFLMVYTLMVIPLVHNTREGVAQSLRPLVQMDEDRFRVLVESACAISPAGELLSLAVGMAVGLAINLLFEPLEENAHRLEVYAYLSRIALFGVVGWTVYVLIATTRLTNVLLRQPLNVDILDIRPFEPIGRQSLWLSLTLIGGAVLSLFSVSYQNQFLWLEYAINYSVVIMVAVLVFFLNMRGAHQVLAATKQRQLQFIDRTLADVYRRFQQLIAEERDTLALATQINAIAAIKQELKAARTWPYNTEMLRTLFISVLAPLFAGLVRLVENLLRS